MIIIHSGQWLSSLISKSLLVIHHKIAKRTCWTEQSEMQYSPFLRTKASAYVEWASIDCTSYKNDCQSGWVLLLNKTHHIWSSGIFQYVLRNLTIIVHWVRGFLRSNTAFKGNLGPVSYYRTVDSTPKTNSAAERVWWSSYDARKNVWMTRLYRWDGDQEKEGGLHEGALRDRLAEEDWPTWGAIWGHLGQYFTPVG